MALSGYMKVTHSGNQVLEGECTLENREKWIRVCAIDHSVKLPTTEDGLPNGKRVHLPIDVIKEVDHTSPKFHQFLSEGEILDEVVIEWYRINPLTSVEEPYYRQTLKSVSINQIKFKMRQSQAGFWEDSNEHNMGHMESISLMYDTICWLYHDGGVEYCDTLASQPSNNTQSQPAQQSPVKKNKPIKHFAAVEIDAHPDAEPIKEKITIVAYNATQDEIGIKHLSRDMVTPETNSFLAEKTDDIELYAVFSEMKEVHEDLKKNKNLKHSIEKGYVEKLKSKKEDINDKIKHSASLKLGPPLRMGVFFDGTGNDAAQKNKNEWSNVKLLSDNYFDNLGSGPTYAHAYMRGVGSEGDGLIEGILGSAAGVGAKDRIAGIIYEIENALKLYYGDYDVFPKTIQLDVFGFSRGATSARHFINVIKQGFYGFDDEKIHGSVKPEHFTISFAGLFDSVGSYGIAGDNDDWGYNFNIDPNWVSGKVYHFIALNEYRKNFDLQTLFKHQDKNYPKDITTDKLIELGFMGVHSDIGGGYGQSQQGIKNTKDNPSQLSLMTLQEMHKIGTAEGVPFGSLSVSTIESDLTAKYQNVAPRLRSDMSLRKNWMKWSEYLSQVGIMEWVLEHNPRYKIRRNTSRGEEVAVKSSRRFMESKIGKVQQEADKIKNAMLKFFSSSDELTTFSEDYIHLHKYYVHKSHAPFNTTIGMGRETDEDHDFERPHRTVFFKEAVDFKSRNDELDRIRYVRGKRKKVDIDEFDLLKAEEFSD